MQANGQPDGADLETKKQKTKNPCQENEPNIRNQKNLVGKMARKDFAETLLNRVERKI